ncbi:MAG: 2-amino-4-hydroxy-6-hydroxymethyldihydropteridine diphosphokinase [Nocardioidaceae bacterium]
MTETPNPNIIDPDTLTEDMRPIRAAVLSLGSNVGDRLAHLQGAIEALADTPEVHVVTVSSVYETKAVGAPAGSGDFLNAVLLADSTLSVATLLDRAKAVEAAYGRERSEVNGPRTLDVDLIVVGDRQSDTDELKLPHPRAHERAFVLVPWHEIDASATIPGRGKIADLLTDLDTSGVVQRDDLELELEG